MAYEDYIRLGDGSPIIDEANPYFIGLFYNEEENVFTDEDGFIVWSIFELITPNDLLLFRDSHDYMVVRHRSMKEVFVELYWPEEDEWDGDPETMCEYCKGERELCSMID